MDINFIVCSKLIALAHKRSPMYIELQVNPKAKVSVKLVAQAGIGTVASGVSKGNADIIQVLVYVSSGISAPLVLQPGKEIMIFFFFLPSP